MFDSDCRAAMIACGINPDDFGTYDQRANAQSAAREDFQKRRCEQLAKDGQSHPAPCKFKGNPSSCTCYRSAEALESEKAQKWLYMNSQSGHLSLNHFYQGKREDPCSNHPPSRNADGSMNGGGYGYRDNDALCMDHAGLHAGEEHYWVCRAEDAHRRDLGTNAAVPQSELERGVENSARVVVDRSQSAQGGAPNVEDGLTLAAGKTAEERAKHGALVDKARSQLAKDLAAAEGAQGAAGTGATQGQSPPNSPAGGGASKEDKDKAVECIKDAWKQAVQEMQATAVAEHSTAGRKSAAEVAAYNARNPNAKVNSISEMPEPERSAAKGRVDAAVEKRQQELRDQHADTAGAKGEPPPKAPTEQDCLDYQGNWLYQNQRPDGTFPPMQGNTGPKPPRGKAPEPPPAENETGF
jgi:hypothetical protein